MPNMPLHNNYIAFAIKGLGHGPTDAGQRSEMAFRRARRKKLIKGVRRAPGEDRTRDLSLTKRTHYHYATEALAAALTQHIFYLYY
jgi:hypothetical protein